MNRLRRNIRHGASANVVASPPSKRSVGVDAGEDPVRASPAALERVEENGIMKVSNMNVDRSNTLVQQGSKHRRNNHTRPGASNNIVAEEHKESSLQPVQKERSQTKNFGSISRSSKKAAEEAVDSYNMTMDESSRQDKQIHLPSDIYKNLATAGHGRASRKSKKSIAPMPTLDEATSEEDESTVAGSAASKVQEEEEDDDEDSSFETWDESNLSFETEVPQQPHMQQPLASCAPQPEQQPGDPPPKKIQPTVMQLLAMDEHRKVCDQIKTKMEIARTKSAEGREEEAISMCRQALQLGRKDVHRVKSQLAKKTSLTAQFHEHWLEIGVFLADIRTCQAGLHERLLDYNHAAACIEEAISIHKRQVAFYKGRSRANQSKALKTVQTLETTLGRIHAAEQQDAKRKQVHQQILQFQREAAAALSKDEKRKAYKQMEETARHLCSLESNVFGEQHPLVGDAYSLLGAIALEQGNVEEATRFMKLALDIMKKTLGMKHPRTGTKLLHLASIYASHGQDDLAIDQYNMAVAIFRSCSATKLVGSTLNDAGVIYIRRKEFDKAMGLLEGSLEAYKSEHGESQNWDIAQVYRNLGECYCQRKDYTSGILALVNGLKVQREGRALFEKAMASPEQPALDNAPPLHLVDDVSIADTLRRLGKAHYGARTFEPALAYYKEACLLHKAEVKKVVHISRSRSNLSLPARQDELAQTVYCMAELYDQIGEFDQASKLFSESLQLRLFSDAHKETRSNMVHCAMCLYGLGGIHLKRLEFEDATAVIRQALSYCDAHGVPENNVIYIMIKARLEEAERGLISVVTDEEALNETMDSMESIDERRSIEELELKAAKAIRDGHVDSAIWILSSVMQQRKELLRQMREKGDPATSVKYDTACTLFTFGKVLVARGDRLNAEKAFKDALKLFKKSGTSANAKIVHQLCDELEKVMKVSSPHKA